ncbi:MAG: hypothetical protein WCK00_17680 [Deltaproteobacteria bacterium]
MDEKTVIGVFGSRSLRDERVKIILLEAIEKFKPAHISTCQEPQGVSEVAQRVAKELGIPLILHFLNFRYLRGAFEHRAREIVKESTHFVIIHDGVSVGTANELKMVKKTGRPHVYEVLENTPYERSVGFCWRRRENVLNLAV